MHPLRLTDEELAELRHLNSMLDAEWEQTKSGYKHALALQGDNLNARLSSLMDAYLDGIVDRTLFEEKKLRLLMERKGLEERRLDLAGGSRTITRKISNFLELVNLLPLSYGMATVPEKREILKTITSNLTAEGKNVVVELKSPFREVANLNLLPTGAPRRCKPRTKAKRILKLLVSHFTAEEEERQRHENLPIAA